MKKIICIVLIFTACLSLGAVFAEEEYSNSADIEYGYDEAYNEEEGIEEEIASDYDDIDTSYDVNYDETHNSSGLSEPAEGEYNDDNAGICVYVNSERIKFDVEPVLINNRTMVPLRAIFEALGAEVTWDNATETAKGCLGDVVVEITIGESKIYKNGIDREIDSPAVMISDRTLVPVRAIAESFECIVNWYDESQTVEILSII